MYRNRVTIERYTHVQDATGGLIPVMELSYSKYADVEDRRGNIQTNGLQRDWSYDYKITMRYEPSRVEQSGDIIRHDGKKLQVNEVSFSGEGTRRFVILRTSTLESNNALINAPVGTYAGRYGWQNTDPSLNMVGAIYQVTSTFTINGNAAISMAGMPVESYLYFEYPATENNFTKYDSGFITNAALPDQTFKIFVQGGKKYIVTKDKQTFTTTEITFKR